MPANFKTDGTHGVTATPLDASSRSRDSTLLLAKGFHFSASLQKFRFSFILPWSPLVRAGRAPRG